MLGQSDGRRANLSGWLSSTQVHQSAQETCSDGVDKITIFFKLYYAQKHPNLWDFMER